MADGLCHVSGFDLGLTGCLNDVWNSCKWFHLWSLTTRVSETWYLGDDPFLFGIGFFSGASWAASLLPLKGFQWPPSRWRSLVWFTRTSEILLTRNYCLGKGSRISQNHRHHYWVVYDSWSLEQEATFEVKLVLRFWGWHHLRFWLMSLATAAPSVPVKKLAIGRWLLGLWEWWLVAHW